MKKTHIFLVAIFIFSCARNERVAMQRWIASSPAGDRFTQIIPYGETILPNGRIIKPLGTQVTVAPHPFGLIVSPDGKTIITSNSGTGPFSISIIQNFELKRRFPR